MELQRGTLSCPTKATKRLWNTLWDYQEHCFQHRTKTAGYPDLLILVYDDIWFGDTSLDLAALQIVHIS